MPIYFSQTHTHIYVFCLYIHIQTHTYCYVHWHHQQLFFSILQSIIYITHFFFLFFFILNSNYYMYCACTARCMCMVNLIKCIYNTQNNHHSVCQFYSRMKNEIEEGEEKKNKQTFWCMIIGVQYKNLHTTDEWRRIEIKKNVNHPFIHLFECITITIYLNAIHHIWICMLLLIYICTCDQHCASYKSRYFSDFWIE